MKRLFILLLLLTVAPGLAFGGWEDFYGCYKTIKYNGVDMQDDPLNVGSIQSLEGSLLALDMEGEEIPTHSILLYKGKTGGVANLTYQDVFKNKGVYSTRDEYLTHEFEGQVRFKIEPEIILEYKLRTQIRKLADGNVELKHSTFIHHPGFEQDEKGEFILQKLECPNDLENLTNQ